MQTYTPWGPVGYITYKRTYARRLDENNAASETEEFPQTVDRVVAATDTQLKCGFDDTEKARLRELLLSLKGAVAGRFYWQLGTKTVDRLGLFSLQNCANVVVDEPVRPFTWTMDALMLGSGVGFNIQKKHVYKLPKVKASLAITRQDTNDADFIVPDSREGWVALLERALQAHFFTGKGFSYSTVCIRGKGAPIKGFGGLASGPEELCWGIAEISRVLNARAGKQIRPIDALDIMNIIGFIVVSGNVRRSAQIAVGDCDDLQYLGAKDWSKGQIPNWRAMSNNSVVCNDIDVLPEQFWKGYLGNGEPYGLINLKLARTQGRLGDTRYKDPGIAGVNPCAEQLLASYETCCLAEIFLPNIKNEDELLETATYLYRICKHSLALDCHAEETGKIVAKNMRMGIGVTGYLQATEEQRAWLPKVYEKLRAFDKAYSKKMGWPESVKLTTCKPSGTLSLLAGVTPGVHPGYAKYFIRRIRMAANSNLVKVCRDHGYPVEYQRNFDGTDDRNTVVVSFPCWYPEGTVIAKDLTAVQQLQWVQKLQTDWSDNAVSCTVYYRKEELSEIRKWMSENYNTGLKTVSFLLHSEHGFAQAPYEEIDGPTFLDLMEKVKGIDGVNMQALANDELDQDCAGGACPIR